MNFHPQTLIELEHVSFAYPSGGGDTDVVTDINLSIQRGEWVTIVGSNGSGKSTLAKLIAKLFTATRGAVSYHMQERPPIQLIFQNPDAQIIGETVYEDLCFGMENYGISREIMRERALEALSKVGLAAHADAPVSQLSGGQKQLLCIAACLVLQPAVVLFDEATSMLDPLARTKIAAVAQQLHREGKTVIWITQWLDELAYADRVVALHNGGIVFDGSTKEFFYGSISDSDWAERTDRSYAGGLDIAAAETSSPNDSTEFHHLPRDGWSSCCERLGFVPPYSVQTARALLQQGFQLDPLPVSTTQLGQAVRAL
ncbi:energy-coupling factor ABC transporter ATP-binding protein [Paenibacillus xerothermodurans]|uniref:energy-coupling factor ABC transporter ATP-binding protein n=1 Tax=Paenibacillus xerothermodurans TaxID=1977292 RepID=UPI00140270AB|nr:ATP-binding cassette domain-containing protein [Paenibacillus xerothermodurans]